MTSGVFASPKWCSLPRSRASGASVASRFCAAMRPTASMIFGLSSAIWFDRYGRQRDTSSGFGSRLPGGRHLRMLAMNTVSRGRPMASSIALSSWPARPTNGSPCRSSSAPGASPITSHSARVLPTPNTVCVRVLHSSQAVQPATRSRSTPQSAGGRKRCPGRERCRRGTGAASRRDFAARRRTSGDRQRLQAGAFLGTQRSMPSASRYALRNGPIGAPQAHPRADAAACALTTAPDRRWRTKRTWQTTSSADPR